MQIENDGYGPNSAIQDLINGLNAAAGAGTFAALAVCSPLCPTLLFYSTRWPISDDPPIRGTANCGPRLKTAKSILCGGHSIPEAAAHGRASTKKCTFHVHVSQ